MAKPFPQLEFLFKKRKPKTDSKSEPTPQPRTPQGTEPTPTGQTQLTDSQLTHWCQQATQKLAHPQLASKISVSWNHRMRTTAGRAWWPTCKIELNPKLHQISEQEIWQTLKHELAHLIAYHRAGRKRIQPHGTEWKTACADLGIPGENARHKLPFTGRKQKKRYAYTCPSCSTTIHRVQPFRRPVACHTCCRSKNAGRYHKQFQLIKNDL